MIDRAIRWRVSVFVVALVMFFALWILSTRESNVFIQFGIAPDDLQGAEVIIDGEVSGTLQRIGGSTRTGFRVGKGEHTISLKHQHFPSEATSFVIDAENPRVMFLVDFAQMFRDGRTQTVIVMNP